MTTTMLMIVMMIVMMVIIMILKPECQKVEHTKRNLGRSQVRCHNFEGDLPCFKRGSGMGRKSD